MKGYDAERGMEFQMSCPSAVGSVKTAEGDSSYLQGSLLWSLTMVLIFEHWDVIFILCHCVLKTILLSISTEQSIQKLKFRNCRLLVSNTVYFRNFLLFFAI